jgi:hypothetical protein
MAQRALFRKVNIKIFTFRTLYCFLLPTTDFSMAGVEGFEPPTYGFGDRRSTN